MTSSPLWARWSDLVVDAEEPRFVVDGLLVEGTTVFVGGKAKSAKTYTLMHLAMCVATGRPFLGQRVQQRPVIYLFLEDGERRARWRMRVLGMAPKDAVDLFAVFPRDRDELFTALEKKGKEEPPWLLIIDPWANFAMLNALGDENSALEVTRLVEERLTRYTRDSRNCILVAHHYRKTGDMMRGSQALEAAPDGWWGIELSRNHPNRRALKWTLRDADAGSLSFDLVIDPKNPPARFTRVEDETPEQSGPTRRATNPRRRSAILDSRVQELLRAEPARRWPATTLAKKLNSSVNTINPILAQLLTRGLVIAPTGHEGWHWNGQQPALPSLDTLL
jgi:hypothetical protein